MRVFAIAASFALASAATAVKKGGNTAPTSPSGSVAANGATYGTAGTCPIKCTSTGNTIQVYHTTSNAAGAHGPANKHADCQDTVGGCTASIVIPHKCVHDAINNKCVCSCMNTVEAAVAATKAPVAAGETIVDFVVDTKLKIAGLTVASFTDAAQLGVRVAFAQAAGVHRDDVSIANIEASSGRRLAEAAAPGVEFDVLVNVFDHAKVTAVKTQLQAVADEPATATHFQEVVIAAMVAEAKVQGESTATLQAVSTTALAPTTTNKSMKAGCYFELAKCPKHPGWVTNGMKYHKSRTALGKAACEHTAFGHHLNCGLEDWEQSKTMWLTADGPSYSQFPKQYVLGGTGKKNVADSGWGCPEHYMEITDSEECKTAGRSFLGDAVYDALPHGMQKGTGLHNGQWTNPTNCGYRAGAYMTFGTKANKDGWWPKLCKLTPKNDAGCSIRKDIRRQHWKGEGKTLKHIGKRNGGLVVTDDTCCAACQARSDCKSWSVYKGTSANNFPDGLCRLLDYEWHPNKGTWHTNSKYTSGGRN